MKIKFLRERRWSSLVALRALGQIATSNLAQENSLTSVLNENFIAQDNQANLLWIV